jgi:hypothetical protein
MAAMFTPRRNVRAALGLGLAATLVLTGCTSDSEPQGEGAEPTPSATESESSEPAAEDYLPVPESVELTEQGADLDFGEKATVAYQPREDTVGVLDLAVTRVDRASIKDLAAFKLDARARKSTPYYVHATVENIGETNLRNTLPPLYVVDGKDRLVQASQFRSQFKPCPSTPLPKDFKRNAPHKACWVYLVSAGQAEGVDFYPLEGFDPIEWTGKFTKPGQDLEKKRKQGGKKKQGGNAG